MMTLPDFNFVGIHGVLHISNGPSELTNACKLPLTNIGTPTNLVTAVHAGQRMSVRPVLPPTATGCSLRVPHNTHSITVLIFDTVSSDDVTCDLERAVVV